MRHLTFLFLLSLLTLSACRSSGGDKVSATGNGGDTIKVRIEELTKTIGDEPSRPDLYNRRAKFYLLDHQLDRALADINKALSFNANEPAYLVTLSDIYLLMGKPESSRDALTKAVGLDSGNKEALLKLAKLYLIIKDYKNCYLAVKQVLALDNNLAAAYFTRAIALLEQGDTIPAVADLQKAVDKNQQYYEAYVQLGELYAIKKNPMAALYLNNALNIRPQSKEALYMLGMFYQENGQYERAITTYLSLARVDTAFREAPYNIGYIYMVYIKDFGKAAAFFTESLRRDPVYFQALYNRGYAYELSGQYQKAYDDYQKTLKIEVNYEKAIEGLNRLDRVMVRK